MGKKKWLIVFEKDILDVVEATTAEEAVEVLARTLPEEDAKDLRECGYAYPLDRVKLNVCVPGWQLAALESGENVKELEPYKNARDWIRVDIGFDMWSPVL